jgi:hypothetical protein
MSSTSPVSCMKQTSCLFSLQSIPRYTCIATSCCSLEILDGASTRDPVMALEAQYVFNSEVWQDLGNHPTEALAAQGARSPCSQTRSRWSRSFVMIGVTSTFFYSISFPLSSIANWVHAVLAFFLLEFCLCPFIVLTSIARMLTDQGCEEIILGI